MITTTRFLAHHHRIASAARALDDERESQAELLRAFEADGGNGAALRLAMRLGALENEEAADFVADFCTYRDWLGIGGRRAGTAASRDTGPPRRRPAADRDLESEIADIGGVGDADGHDDQDDPDGAAPWPDVEELPE